MKADPFGPDILGPNPPVMKLHDVLTNRKPEAVPQRLVMILGLGKFVEDKRKFLFFDTLSLIVDRDFKLFGGILHNGDKNLSSLAKMFDGIVNEVPDDLAELERVRQDFCLARQIGDDFKFP